MNKPTKPKRNPTLKSVQRQFQYWRSKRKPRTSIPEKLWNAAIELSREHSLNKVAKTLRLNHTALSERVTKTEPAPKSAKPSGNKFVELDLKGALFQGTAPGCEIEVTDDRGWKLRLSGSRLEELLSAAQHIWRGEL